MSDPNLKGWKNAAIYWHDAFRQASIHRDQANADIASLEKELEARTEELKAASKRAALAENWAADSMEELKVCREKLALAAHEHIAQELSRVRDAAMIKTADGYCKCKICRAIWHIDDGEFHLGDCALDNLSPEAREYKAVDK